MLFQPSRRGLLEPARLKIEVGQQGLRPKGGGSGAFEILEFDREILDTSLRLIEQLRGAPGNRMAHATTALA